MNVNAGELLMADFVAFIIPVMICGMVAFGLYRKVALYEAFTDGAKEGFQVGVRIIPYLVAILFAIGMFRASGAMELLTSLFRPVLDTVGFPAELIPMALVRPLSGSGSVGILADLINTFGEDALVVKMAATMFGSTETTFYVLAVYFGAVGIKKYRYALKVGLIADLSGIISAVAVCHWLFG
jgi:spore maturation protein B